MATYLNYVPHPDKLGHYYDPYSGESISRYRWRKMKTADIDAGNVPDLAAIQNTDNYRRWRRYYAEEHHISEKQAERSATFRALLAGVYTADNEPTGRKAWALVNLGYRQPEDDLPVGETPTEQVA